MILSNKALFLVGGIWDIEQPPASGVTRGRMDKEKRSMST
jgi:hypothetical protein